MPKFLKKSSDKSYNKTVEVGLGFEADSPIKKGIKPIKKRIQNVGAKINLFDIWSNYIFWNFIFLQVFITLVLFTYIITSYSNLSSEIGLDFNYDSGLDQLVSKEVVFIFPTLHLLLAIFTIALIFRFRRYKNYLLVMIPVSILLAFFELHALGDQFIKFHEYGI